LNRLLTFFCILCICFYTSFGRRRYSRQTASVTCRGSDGSSYRPGQSWSLEAGSKTFVCECKVSGRTHCDWAQNKKTEATCYDRRSRKKWKLGQKFTKVNGGRTMDCTCKKRSPSSSLLVIECSTSNRCTHEGRSYVQGYRWKHTDKEGTDFNCLCLAQAVVSCKAEVRTQISEVKVSAPVYSNQIVRKGVAGFQACDIGNRVVSAGFAWNETVSVNDDVIDIKSCTCNNALIICKVIRKSRSREPHCLTKNGDVHMVGDEWVEHHKYTTNLKWKCRCEGNAQPNCQDEGTCPDLKPPANGAMLCISAADRGQVTRTKYCKPLCERGYDFQSKPRRYRAYETCGRLNSHRWSVGYVDDHLLIAKCLPSNKRVRYYSHYLQTTCENLTEAQKDAVKNPFMQILTSRGLCKYGCRFESFTCG